MEFGVLEGVRENGVMLLGGFGDLVDGDERLGGEIRGGVKGEFVGLDKVVNKMMKGFMNVLLGCRLGEWGWEGKW